MSLTNCYTDIILLFTNCTIKIISFHKYNEVSVKPSISEPEFDMFIFVCYVNMSGICLADVYLLL